MNVATNLAEGIFRAVASKQLFDVHKLDLSDKHFLFDQLKLDLCGQACWCDIYFFAQSQEPGHILI